MMNKSLRLWGRESSGNRIYGFQQMRTQKKSRRFRRLLKLITGRRQTEWTGATRCPNEDEHSHIRESLIDRKRAVFFRLRLPCRPLAEWAARLHDLKKLFAASLDARFFAIAACSRSISDVISAMRSVSSSTDSSDRSCPISWVIFFRGLS